MQSRDKNIKALESEEYYAALDGFSLVAHKIGLAEQSPGEILPFSAGSSDNISAFLQHLTLTNALGLSEGLTFNPPSWTIGAEFCTYLIFAAMMMWFRPKRAVHFISILLGVVAIYASCF